MDSLEPDEEGTIVYHSSAAGASFIKKEDMELDEAEREARKNAEAEGGNAENETDGGDSEGENEE